MLCANLPPNLEELVLELRGCDMTSSKVPDVVWPSSLRVLFLTFQMSETVDHYVIASLMQRLPVGLQTLELCLQECISIGDASVEVIARMLPRNLRELRLYLLGTAVTLQTM